MFGAFFYHYRLADREYPSLFTAALAIYHHDDESQAEFRGSWGGDGEMIIINSHMLRDFPL